MADHAAPTGAPPVNRRSLLTLASIAVALAAADTYVVVLALTDMMAGVGIGIDALQEATPIISGFLLGYIAVLPLIGRLSDVLDRQRILLGCLVVFIIGSAITALAVDMSVLVTGRVLQGIGGGGLVPATLALVADLWPADRRGTPLGVVGAVQELGSVLGPVLGAVILAVADWRMIFWVNVVFAAVLYAAIALTGRRARPVAGEPSSSGRGLRIAARVVALLAVAVGALTLWAPERLTTDITLGAPFVPFSGESRVLTPIGLVALVLIVVYAILTAPRWWAVLRQLDLFGALLIAIALGALVLTFSSSDPEKEVVGPLGLTLLPVGALALILLAWWHRKAADPLIPRGVLHRRGVTALVVSLLVGASLVAVIVDVPLLTRLVEGKTATDGALVLVRFLVAVPFGALLGGWLLRKAGDGLVAGVGLVLAAVGMFFMSRWTLAAVDAHVSTTVILVLVGFGVGLALAPVNNSALADSPSDAHGIASSLVVVARMVGMVVGLALLTAIGLNRYFDAVRALPNPTDTAALIGAGVVQVQTVFLGGALAALLGGLIAFSMGIRRDASDPDAARVSPLGGI